MEYSLALLDGLDANPLEFALWLNQENFIRTEGHRCRHCDSALHLRLLEENIDRVVLRCIAPNCRYYHSIRADSFFAYSKLPIKRILEIVICFAAGTSISNTADLFEHNRKTVSRIYRFIRELIQINLQGDPIQFDEPGVFQTDETVYDHLRDDQGNVVAKQWVAGIYHNATGNCKLYLVPNRSAEALLPPLIENIPAGSLICTDAFASYNALGEHFTHRSVNHSEGEYARHENIPGFGDVVITTNGLEATWGHVRHLVTNRGCNTLKLLRLYLDEKIFRNANRSIFNLIKM